MARTVIISLLILIALPSIAVISEIYFIGVAAGYPSYLRYYEISVVIVLLIYALYPILIRGKRYFNRQDFEELVLEYEFLKKLIFCGVPLLILVMLVFLLTVDPEDVNYSYALLPGLILIVSSAFLKITSNISYRDYRYYFAKGCFQLLNRRNDASEKMIYFMKGINSYNKYLKRNLKLQMSNTENIYSKIISDPSLEQHKFTSSITAVFQTDDKLEPIKY